MFYDDEGGQDWSQLPEKDHLQGEQNYHEWARSMRNRLGVLGLWDLIENFIDGGPTPVLKDPEAEYRSAVEAWELKESFGHLSTTEDKPEEAVSESPSAPKPPPPTKEQMRRYQDDRQRRAQLSIVLEINVTGTIKSRHFSYRYPSEGDDPVVIWKELKEQYGDHNTRVRGRLYRQLRTIPASPGFSIDNVAPRLNQYMDLCKRYIKSLPSADSELDNKAIKEALSISFALDFAAAIRLAEDERMSNFGLMLLMGDDFDLDGLGEKVRPWVRSTMALEGLRAQRDGNQGGGGRGRGGRGRGRGGIGA